jgi:hypothetical protein
MHELASNLQVPPLGEVQFDYLMLQDKYDENEEDHSLVSQTGQEIQYNQKCEPHNESFVIYQLPLIVPSYAIDYT